MATKPYELRFQREYTVENNYAGRAARAFFRYVAFRFSRWGPAVLLILALFALAFVRGGHWWIYAPVGAFGALVSIPAFILRATLRIRRIAPDGTTFRLGFTEGALLLHLPSAAQQTPLSAYERVRVGGDFVFMKKRGSNANTILPAELFTEESLAWLRSKIAAQTP